MLGTAQALPMSQLLPPPPPPPPQLPDAVGVAVDVAAGVVAERLANDEARASGRSPKLFNTSGWVAVRVAFSGQEAEMPRIYSELQSLFVSDLFTL